MPKLGKLFPSNYINASDFENGEYVSKIKGVEIRTLGQGSDAQQKPVILFAGTDKGLVLNKTNGRMIAVLLGSDDTDDWIGKEVGLGTVWTQNMQGDPVKGVRVKPVDELKDPIHGPPGVHPDSSADDDLPF